MRTLHSRNTLFAVFSLFLFSCGAKKAPERLTVIAPQDFTGKIKITMCDLDAKSDYILLDASGKGRTSVCAATPDFTLRVVSGSTTFVSVRFRPSCVEGMQLLRTLRF